MYALAFCALITGCENKPAEEKKPEGSEKVLSVEEAKKDLKIETTKPGTGTDVADTGDTILMEYTGTLKDGTVFDANTDPEKGSPYAVTLGESPVIEGWTLGLKGIKKGEERKLTIPGALGYGESGSGDKIGPNATLIFQTKCMYLIKQGHSKDVEMKTIQQGTGEGAADGDELTVHYTGKLLNGKVFDTSLKGPKTPYKFKIGGNVIQGWSFGCTGMKKGEKRHLIIPPAMAYGPQGSGTAIGPNQVLEFDIECLGISKKAG